MDDARRRTLIHGLVTGSIGYAVVVVFFALANVFQGRSPFFTAAVLGNALLGTPGTAVAPAPVAVYNGLHLIVFLVLGFAAAWLAAVVVRRPQLWYFFLFLAIFALFHLFGVVAALATRGGSVSLVLVLAASLLAVLAMAGWLWRAYPELPGVVRDAGDLEDPPLSGRARPAS
jgi:hypothetical protein